MSSRRVKICKPTGGVVDLALVVDMDAVRRRRRAERATRKGRTRTVKPTVVSDPLHASADEKRMRASLRDAWNFAAPGPEKRAALAKLRAYERRHGMDTATPLRREVAVAEASERWG